MLARPDAIEALAKVTHVVLDKTGTLTEGKVRLADARVATGWTRGEALALAAALEVRSEHPIARALVAASAGDPDAPGAPAAGALAHAPGAGVEGVVPAGRYRLGRIDYVAAIAGAIPADLGAFARAADARTSLVALGSERGFAAVFALGDVLRHGAKAMVARLAAMGIEVSVLSGDREAAAVAFASAAGIARARGDRTPGDKRDAIADLQSDGAVVAMVGDGVNDAPPLAQAQVSISLAQATPVAQLVSDVVILAGGLERIAEAIAQARRTRAIVRQNLAWATIYNVVAIPAAALGYVTPLLAALGMSASSLAVVGNAARLIRPPGSR